jgi:hypothetical protein
MRFGFSLLLIFSLLVMQGCTAGPNPAVGMAAADGGTAGFFAGLWHGIICPITFFISLFTENVNVYEVHNVGGFYDFGFVLGAGILGSSSGSTARRKRK